MPGVISIQRTTAVTGRPPKDFDFNTDAFGRSGSRHGSVAFGVHFQAIIESYAVAACPSVFIDLINIMPQHRVKSRDSDEDI